MTAAEARRTSPVRQPTARRRRSSDGIAPLCDGGDAGGAAGSAAGVGDGLEAGGFGCSGDAIEVGVGVRLLNRTDAAGHRKIRPTSRAPSEASTVPRLATCYITRAARRPEYPRLQVIQSGASLVIPSGAAQRRSRGIAVIPSEAGAARARGVEESLLSR